MLEHDVDVGDTVPIKQRSYRLHHQMVAVVKKELDFTLRHEMVEPCQSEWSSPVTLVPKSDGSYRLCIDYRKVNACTTTDSNPMPRVDQCIDAVGNAKFITRIDLLKCFWQVPLTSRA